MVPCPYHPNLQKGEGKDGAGRRMRLKPEMPISSKITEETKTFPGAKATTKEKAEKDLSSMTNLGRSQLSWTLSRDLLSKLMQYAKYQFKWNNTFLDLEEKCRENPMALMTNLPGFFSQGKVPSTGSKRQSQAADKGSSTSKTNEEGKS